MAESRFKHFVKYVVIDILLAALISFFLINYVVSAFKIEGDSMKPLLRAQERILISKLAVRRDNLRRFDIVVLYKPDEPDKSLIKRIIGLPGEIIEIRGGDVLINDKPLKQDFPAATPRRQVARGHEGAAHPARHVLRHGRQPRHQLRFAPVRPGAAEVHLRQGLFPLLAARRHGQDRVAPPAACRSPA